MKTLKHWLDEYSESHQNPTNKFLHWVCIPLIVFSLWAALKSIPVGTALINPATVTIVLFLAYYLRLSWQLAAGMVLIFTLMYVGVLGLEALLGTHLIWAAALIFIAAWVGQFVGHQIEGAKPSFFKDLQFLLIGPLWLLADLYRRLAIPMGRGALPQH